MSGQGKYLPLWCRLTLYNDIVIQIDRFLCLRYVYRQIKPGETQLKNKPLKQSKQEINIS